jgi:hypothetical protein
MIKSTFLGENSPAVLYLQTKRMKINHSKSLSSDSVVEKSSCTLPIDFHDMKLMIERYSLRVSVHQQRRNAIFWWPYSEGRL